jgi:uncharacterized delta-60 repeat protein
MNVRHETNRSRRILTQAVEALESRRLLSFGALDPSFGAGGKVLTDFNGGASSGYAMAVSGGKTLVAGTLNGDFVVARYNANGSLDTTFGPSHTGYATVDFGSDADEAYAITVQPDGRIVLAGQTNRGASFYDFAVARLNADGSLDTTFGAAQNGKLCADFAGDFDQATGIGVAPDGGIVVSGMATVDFNAQFALMRLTADGAPDTSFGAAHTGKVLTEWTSAYAESTGMGIQADGRIVLVGYAS